MKTRLKFSTEAITAFLLFGVIVVFSCTKSQSPAMPNPSMPANQISMVDMSFAPSSTTITTGTTVTWTNNSTLTHTVTDYAGSFNSGDIAPGGIFTHTFTSAGTVNYHCLIHADMVATITVTGTSSISKK